MAAVTTADSWKNFPRYMILAMGLVVAVNVRFIYMAVATFPGAATADDFDTSNRYNAVLDVVAKQDALGWTEQASAEGAKPVVALTGPDGKALAGATVTAQAVRPLGPSMATDLKFREIAPGHYVAAQDLAEPGQWDLMLTAAQGGHTVHVTRRLIVKD